MDAKANTQFCVAPITQFEVETERTEAHAAYLIVVSGGIPGTMHPLDERGTSLGRSVENSLQLSDSTVSRRHAFVSIDSKGGFRIKDDGSTNGTFLNGQRIPAHSSRPLDDGDRIQLGTNVVLKLVCLDPGEERFQREMFERTVRDCLTGLYNRAYFIEQFGALAERYVAHGIGMAILMIDVDHFKRVNDNYGHVVGDEVLREVATVIRESTRAEDLIARYGGEEFIVALPVSCPEMAIDRAERIRRNLAEREVWADPEPIQITASIGLAFGPPGRSRHERSLILRADQALYQAKADGRNCVVYGHPDTFMANSKTESAEFPVCRPISHPKEHRIPLASAIAEGT
jgi:two-component system, cell cycle response regulator